MPPVRHSGRSREAGFTLIELLAALTAASLLMITIGYIIGQLTTDWQRTGKAQQPAELTAALATTRMLLSQALPAAEGSGSIAFEGSRHDLTARILPPQAIGYAGPLTLHLSRKQTADGVALQLRLTPADNTLARSPGLPENAFSEYILADGLNDVQFRFIGGPQDLQDPLNGWPASANLPAVVIITLVPKNPSSTEQSLWVSPAANIDGRCLFDPISTNCRL